MKKSAMCTVRTRAQAEQIVGKLRDAGFANDRISVLAPHDQRAGYDEVEVAELGQTAGAIAGGGTLAIAGIGRLVAAGPVLARLGGAAGGSVGSVAGALVETGIPEMEARRVERRVREGNVFLSVRAEDVDQLILAEEIFDEANAEDVCTTFDASSYRPVESRP